MIRPALIQIDKPERVATIAIMRHADKSHASCSLLGSLVVNHPTCVSDIALIRTCGLSGHQQAALAWHVMRVNDSLPLVGWKIHVDAWGDHSLIAISDSWFQKLVDRYERRRRVA